MAVKQGIYHDYDLHANDEVPKVAVCAICDQPLRCRWTDLHGEAVCLTCGAPYQLLHYEGKQRVTRPPRLKCRDEYVSRLRRYWQETRKPSGFGTYIRHPEPEHLNAFVEWWEREQGGEE